MKHLYAFFVQLVAKRRSEDNLRYDGGGRVSVPVERIVSSPKVQTTVAVLREWLAEQPRKGRKG